MEIETNLDKLAFLFFKLFAQYESSLKERGFFNTDRNGNIYVDWDRFANEVVGKDYRVKLATVSEAVEYILNTPPKKQSSVDNRIIWIDVPNTEKSVQILFSHICRVRNNLFHGAKFNGTWSDPERSELLLKHSLDILSAIQDFI